MESQASHKTLQPGEMLNWYQIERILGRGGFGVIYLATDTNLDHQVAIKEYLPSDVATRTNDSQVQPITEEHGDMFRWGMERFIKEARNLVKFKHPNIVRVMSVFQENNTAYMVMEFEEGVDLRSFLRKPGATTEASLKQLLLPISEGLAEVHRHGFIHRDIKPANILVRKDGSPVLLDFGSARSASKQTEQSLTALVSVGYAPLEQYNSEADEQQGPWTDIYALGGTLYYAISGRDPVESTRRGAALLNGGADPLIAAEYLGEGKYSAGFLRAVDWAMRFAIADRPQTLNDWIPALLAEQVDPIPDSQFENGTALDRLTTFRPNFTKRTAEDLSDATVLSRQRRTGRDRYSKPLSAPLSERVSTPKRPSAPNQSRRKKKSGSGFRNLAVVALLLAIVSTVLWYNTDQRDKQADARAAAEAQAANEAKVEQAKLAAQQAENEKEQREADREEQIEAERQAELLRQEQEQKDKDKAKLEAAANAEKLKAEAEANKQAEANAKKEQQAASDKLIADELAAKELEQKTAEAKIARAREAELLEQQAESRAVARKERRLKQAIGAAQKSLSVGDLNAAQRQLENAQTLAPTDPRVQTLGFALQTAVDEHNIPVSDADFDKIARNFDALKRAIESKDTAALDRLAIPSEQSDLFKRLMNNNYDRIDVSVSDIRLRNVDKSITGTLRIDTLVRANGDRGSLSEKYTSRTITSRRINGGWSKIEW